MKSVSILVYCDGDIIPSYEGIMFECPSGPKVITIIEDMSLDALRKTFFYANGDCKFLLDLFYRYPIYIGDDCVEYDCMELKHDDDEGKIFFIYSKFSIKGHIELKTTFGCFLGVILALLHKPRKPITTNEIIALMHDESL